VLACELQAVVVVVWPDESHIWLAYAQFRRAVKSEPHFESDWAIWHAWICDMVGAGSAEHLLELLQLAPPPPPPDELLLHPVPIAAVPIRQAAKSTISVRFMKMILPVLDFVANTVRDRST
jgi:hypothetical protein